MSEPAQPAVDPPPPPPEEPKMEIHHKPKPVHSWREFLSEYAIIVLGVLTALAGEQAVEYVHHLGQLQTARQELREELEQNRVNFQQNAVALSQAKAELESDMALLRAARDSQKPLAGKLDYSPLGWKRPRDYVWLSMEQNGTLALMPHAELQKYGYLYALMGDFYTRQVAMSEQMNVAGAIAQRSPDSSLSGKDIDELITTTSNVQGKLAFAQIMFGYVVDLGIKGAE